MLHLKLFGHFELTGPAGRIALSSAKLSAFLTYLALAAKPVLREQLTTLLWGSHFEDQARQNFRQALARLRKVIGSDAINANDQTVELSPDAVVTDVREFETLVRSGSPEDLRRAVTLLDGDLLAGIDVKDAAWDEWLSGERRRIGNIACDALERLGRIELTQARGAEALRLAEDCIRRDIFREDAHRLAIQAYVALGRRAEALKHYQGLVERLKQDLNTTPEAATVQVNERARLDMGAGTEPQTVAPGRKPSIAVLPFANLSNDPEQDYFAEGITEDITTELSRFRQMHVVSRNFSSRFRGQDLDMIRIGRELSVRYLLEGSVRRMGARIRITAQLIDAATGNHIWAERYDNAQDEIFDVQDRVVQTIVGTLAGRMNSAGAELSRRKSPANLAAYECVLRGDALPWGTPEVEAEARLLFERAIELDPSYARAYALLSFVLEREWFRDMSGSNRLLDEAFDLARKAVTLDENDTLCQLAMVWTQVYRGAHELAEQHLAKALALNPNQPSTQTDLAIFNNYRGEPERAIEGLLEAKRLDPFFNPSWYWGELGAAYFNARRYDDAISSMRRSTALSSEQQARLAASYALAGKPDLARECTADLLRRLPAFSASRFLAKEPLLRPEDRQHLADGLRKAGLPE